MRFDRYAIITAKQLNRRKTVDVRILKVKEDNARFLHTIMNEPDILDVLNEVPTQLCDWSGAISAWDSDPDEEDYIIFDDKTPVGWLGINGLLSGDKTAFIKMIVLLPQYQNMGIGSCVVDQCLTDLRFRGFERVMLYTDEDNYRAQKCYSKCGFTVTQKLTEKMSNGNIAGRYKMQCTL